MVVVIVQSDAAISKHISSRIKSQTNIILKAKSTKAFGKLCWIITSKSTNDHAYLFPVLSALDSPIQIKTRIEGQKA